jgi:hypothetical protein
VKELSVQRGWRKEKEKKIAEIFVDAMKHIYDGPQWTYMDFVF